MKTSEKLRQRLKLHGHDVASFSRTRAGAWQRSQGAWSWEATCVTPDALRYVIGSQQSMTELLKMSDEDFLGWID